MCAMMQKFRWNCGSMYLFYRRRKDPHALSFPKVSRWEHRRTARNRNLGTISLPQIGEGVSRPGECSVCVKTAAANQQPRMTPACRERPAAKDFACGRRYYNKQISGGTD